MEDVLTGFPFKKGMPQVQKGTTPQNKNVVISPDRKRAIFSQVLANKGINTDNAIVSEGYIRIERRLENGRNKISFSIVRDANSDTPTERKIDRNDKFLVTEMGIFLMHRSESKRGIEVLQTYPNTKVFVAKDGGDTIANDLEAIYNGNISVKVGQTKFIEGMDLLRFRNVPQTQQNATNANSQSTGKQGFFETTPQILFDGNQKHEIDIELPIDSTVTIASDVADHNNYIVLFCRGFLISNK